MSLVLQLVVLSLATFRLTRLVVRDDFPPILWARKRVQNARPLVWVQGDEYRYWWLGELVSCHWCASAYISGGLVLSTWLIHGMALPIFCWLAVWGAGAFIAHLADKPH